MVTTLQYENLITTTESSTNDGISALQGYVGGNNSFAGWANTLLNTGTTLLSVADVYSQLSGGEGLGFLGLAAQFQLNVLKLGVSTADLASAIHSGNNVEIAASVFDTLSAITGIAGSVPAEGPATIALNLLSIGFAQISSAITNNPAEVNSIINSLANPQNLLSQLMNQADAGVNGLIDGAASSSTFANWVSFLLGNAQNQTDDENDPFGVDDPLVISTNGRAVTTTSLANGAFVDYQGTGFAEQSSWFSANAGILVDVTNPNGTLNNGFTIIGSSATNQNGNKLGQAGFTQLATLDTNHDGVINASDTDFSQIELWVGSDGQPGSGHLETLAQAGITSISLNSTAVNTIDANGDKTLATSTVTYGNGTTGTLSDMNMSVNTSNTIDESAGTVNSAYANLPDVAGWGDVHNLQVAMALDTTGNLANLVKQYLAATPAEQPSLINNLIFTWTGVQNDPQETAYGFAGDTREIDALSKFVGAQYSNNSGNPYFMTAAGFSLVQAAWNQLVNYVSGCLLDYGTNQNLLSDVQLTYNPTTQSFTYDVSGLVNALSNVSTTQQLEFGTFLSGSSAYNGIVSALNAYYPSPSTSFQQIIATLGTAQQASAIIASNAASLVVDSNTILNGSNDTVSVSVPVPVTLTLASGSGNTVTQSQGYETVNLIVQAANSSNTLDGNTGTFDVTAQANGDALTLAGSYNTLTQTGGDAMTSRLNRNTAYQARQLLKAA